MYQIYELKTFSYDNDTISVDSALETDIGAFIRITILICDLFQHASLGVLLH